MAALDPPHLEAVPPTVQAVLGTLAKLPLLRDFYLAGGTALALRLGHRLSRDLDLFAAIDSLDDSLRRRIIEALRQTHTVEIEADSIMGLSLAVDGQPVSFFSYGYPLIESVSRMGEMQIAGLLDIALMKLDAIMGRGMRKDFYDLYFIAAHVPLEEIFKRSANKYPHSPTFNVRALTALVDFDRADNQPDPSMLLPADWEQVKKFFQSEARRLGQKWFAPPDSGSS